MRRAAPVFMEQSDRFTPEPGWLDLVQTLATRYGETYGVFREAGVHKTEFAKPGRAYVYLVRPKIERKRGWKVKAA